jgi:hypothetical protein
MRYFMAEKPWMTTRNHARRVRTSPQRTERILNVWEHEVTNWKLEIYTELRVGNL